MKNKIGSDKMKIIYIVSAIAIILLTYFFIYQKNMDQVFETEAKNRTLDERVVSLQGLQALVNEMEQTSVAKKDEMDKYLASFAPKITQEKMIYQMYQMMVKTGVRITSAERSNLKIFYNEAKIIEETNENTSSEEEQKTKEQSEENKDEKKPIEKLTGCRLDYDIGIAGGYKQVMDALDWIAKCEEKMSVGATSLAFDASTGELIGRVTIHFYVMVGNGANYVPPNISGIEFGIKNLFGTKK